jgi:hypothetical protein
MEVQMNALNSLRQESEALYQQAIQVFNTMKIHLLLANQIIYQSRLIKNNLFQRNTISKYTKTFRPRKKIPVFLLTYSKTLGSVDRKNI